MVLDNLVVDITAMLVMSYLNNLFVPLLGQGLGAGARGWVVDTTGHGGDSILQGLGC